MTGDASRLLAWKGLGGTPATVFTITFPPTVAERDKGKQMNNKEREQPVGPACVETYQPGLLCPLWHFL